MDERTQRVISNSVSEYLTVRNASEGLATFTTLAAEERPALVSAFIEKAIDGKPAIVSTVVDLFRAVADAGVIQQQAMRDAFTQAVAELQDTATEAPAAYDNLGRLMTAAGLDEGDVQHLQGLMTSVDEGDEQGLQDARKRLMDAYRAAFASSVSRFVVGVERADMLCAEITKYPSSSDIRRCTVYSSLSRRPVPGPMPRSRQWKQGAGICTLIVGKAYSSSTTYTLQ